jgi:hypothetical protein
MSHAFLQMNHTGELPVVGPAALAVLVDDVLVGEGQAGILDAHLIRGKEIWDNGAYKHVYLCVCVSVCECVSV